MLTEEESVILETVRLMIKMWLEISIFNEIKL